MRHLLALLVLLAPAVAHADFDRWFVLEMQGQRAGYAHMTQSETGGVVTSVNEMEISVRRGPVAITIRQRQQFEETPAGEPIRATSVLDMGAMAMTRSYVFTEGGIEVTGAQGGREQTRTLPPIRGDWLTPAAAQRYVEEQIQQGAKTINLRTVDLSMGVQPIDATMTLAGRENIEVFGKTVPAIAWDMTVSAMPGLKMREYVDGQGRTLKSTVSLMPGMEFTMLAADEQLARMHVNPPEVLAAMMITPAPGSAAMTNPRALRSAIYEVRLKPGANIDHFDLPRAGYQRVVWGDQGVARVVVDLDHPVNPVDDVPTDAHLAASMMLNYNDPKIQELLTRGLGSNAPAMTDADKAERLRAFVHDYLTEKSLAVGFATASEVARTREGDCSEHAVLLAALLRGAGIPSRTATGLLYVEQFVGQRQVFGGHMWAQAWLAGPAGGHWADFDAVLPDHSFDAAHITLGIATLNDGEVTNELVKMAPLLGSLQIKVIEAR